MNNMTTIGFIPAVLICTSAVLVDHALPTSHWEDRIRAQIGLWLAASLQRIDFPTKASLAWATLHLCFVFSILAILADKLMMKSLWATRTARKLRNYHVFLAPSTLVVLFYTCYGAPQTANQSALVRCGAIFGGTFLTLSLTKWYWTNLNQTEETLQGIPLSNRGALASSYYAQGSMLEDDESNWESWKPSQVLRWIASQRKDWRTTICSQVAAECISGQELDGLTVHDLRSMGVPYGHARGLVDQIHILVSKYPSSRTNRPTFSEGSDDILQSGGWLGDAETNRFTTAGAGADYAPHRPPRSFLTEDLPELDPETVKRAKSVMEQRFGFQLPDLKTTEEASTATTTSTTASKTAVDQTTTLAETGPNDQGTPAAKPPPLPLKTSPGIPSNVLEAMPPHIREIAMRKPELVEQIYSARAHAPPNPRNALGVVQEQDEGAKDDSDEEAFGDGGETVSLLRKRHR